MKYKKGEKLQSIGAVYEYLYSYGIVSSELDGLLFKIKEDLLFYDNGTNCWLRTSGLLVEDGEYFKALREEEEPLKMPEFFKVYKHKTNSDIGVVTAISNDKVFICGCFWQLKDFLANFEEVAK